MTSESPLLSAGRRTDAAGIMVGSSIWMRNRRHTLAFSGFLLANTALYLWLAVYGFLGKAGDGGGGIGVLGLALAALSGLLAVRHARAGLWMGPDGIVVRGPFKTYRVAASSATGFVAGFVAKSAPAPMLQRKHGRPLRVSALSRGGGLTSRFPALVAQLEPLCDELNALLKTLQAGAPSSSDAADAASAQHEEAHEYRLLRASLLLSGAAYWIIPVVLVALRPTPVFAVWMAVVAVSGTVSTYLILRQVRKNRSKRDAKQPVAQDRPDVGL
jgi:hypothetical protein